MRFRTAVFVTAMTFSGSALVFAQDPVKVDPSHYKVLVDNASVRVLEVNYEAGGKSVMHAHPDSVIIPLVASKVRFNTPDGKFTDQELPADSATCAPAGVHSPTNIGTTRVRAIVVELKGAKGTATLPAQRAGLTMKPLADCGQAVASRNTADPAFAEPAGTKHDYDQVVVALGSGQMSLSIDGKPAKTSWTKGDTAFIGRGTAHESKNQSGKPIDFIIVSVK
jgi:quercetin dioxygenase-like cupin family protein